MIEVERGAARSGQLLLLVLLCAAAPLRAQGVNGAQPGEAAETTLRMQQTLEHLEAAADTAAVPALLQAAHLAVSLAEYQPPTPARDSLFARAVRYAERAVALDSTDAHARFMLARALGHHVLAQGVREQARLATRIREEAVAALAIQPTHAGALHVLGLWHHNVMKLNKVQRLIARTFLGARTMSEASWEDARASLETAVRLEPDVIVHRLNLGRLYLDMGEKEKARTQLQWVIDATPRAYNDGNYRREAEKALRKLGG